MSVAPVDTETIAFLRLAGFGSLRPAVLEALAVQVCHVSFPAQAMVLRQGDPGDACYLICAGRVEIIEVSDHGNTRTVGTLGVGEIFGEIALLTGSPRTASVHTVEPTELLMLPRGALIEAIRADPMVRDRMFELLQLRDRPRRRDGIEVHYHHTADGAEQIVLKDAPRGVYFRLSPDGWFLWQLLDGTRHVKDLTLAYGQAYPRPAPNAVMAVIIALAQAGFIHTRADASQRHRETQSSWSRWCARLYRTCIWTGYLRRVDRWVTWCYRYLFRHLYTPLGCAVLLGVTISGMLRFGLALQTNWIAGIAQHPALWWTVLVAYGVAIVVHEAGHALTTKHYGREIYGIGIGLYGPIPLLFADTSEMWLAPRWSRLAVSLAGPAANFFCAAVCAWIAWGAPHPVTDALLLSIAGVSCVLGIINLVPIGATDGSAALSEFR